MGEVLLVSFLHDDSKPTMMKPTLYLPRFIFLITLLLSIAACEKGNGVLTTQTFEIDSFDKIELHRHANVYITVGPTRSVSIEAEENLMDLITTDVVDGTWKIDFKKTVKEYLRMNIHITVPTISSLKVVDGSGGDIYLENKLEAANLILLLSGDGTINGEVAIADKLTTTLEGSGRINITGTADKHEVNSSGAGIVAMYDLVANTGSVTTSGSGDVQIHYTGNWNALITGAGNIRYKGIAPASVDTTGGSGRVILMP
ncbi:head GIN domain-containing protein [soil metagenome]